MVAEGTKPCLACCNFVLVETRAWTDQPILNKQTKNVLLRKSFLWMHVDLGGGISKKSDRKNLLEQT